MTVRMITIDHVLGNVLSIILKKKLDTSLKHWTEQCTCLKRSKTNITQGFCLIFSRRHVVYLMVDGE